ncbi:MAG: alpha/beta hydrolase [Acetobacteraceae bacterium]|nr:alpha/beta hydrolase [Acetobacteraceae bacterium]
MLFRLARFASLLAASAIVPSCAPVDALNASIDLSGLSISRDIAYAPGPMGMMDVYRPSAPRAAKLPLLVFVHGGAWKSGNRGEYQFVGAPLARLGMVVAIPDYRKSPQAGFPTFLEDNARAIAFARNRATAWGADPQRIFLIGHSAGGYNVLMLALDPRYLNAVGMRPTDLAGVVGMSAPTDFIPSTDPDVAAAFGPSPRPEEMQPINFARKDAPPILLLHGGKDDIVSPHNTASLRRHMMAVGGEVRVQTFPDLGHIGLVVAVAPISAWRAPVRNAIIEFIRAPA